MKNIESKNYLPLASVIALAVSQSTLAETNTPAAATGPVLEEVIITAQRRSESLQDTPIAITALSDKALAEQGIRSPVDLADRIPSLQIGTSGQIYLRGVGTPNVNEVADPTVATHLDGIYLARPAGVIGAGIYDAARVEVLRGPQGTLYGRNATSGSINIVTRKPEFENNGSVSIEAGNYGTVVSSGYANIALSETVALRGSFQTNSHQGYLDSTNSEHPDYDSADSKSARLQLLIEPRDDLSVLLRGDYTRDNGLRSTFGIVRKTVGETVDEDTSSGAYPAYNDSEYAGFSAEVNWDLAQGTLTYLGGYRLTEVDNNGEYLPFNGAIVNYSKDETIQQELRFVGETDSLTYIVGLFYFDEENAVDASFQAGPGGIFFQFDQDPVIAKSLAAYGQATYTIVDSLRATAGVRYTKDKKSRDGVGNLLDVDFSFIDQFTENSASGEWEKVNWKLGFEYDMGADAMLYANVGTGYKAGGYFDGTTNNTFEPEDIRAYETGVKSQWLDNTLTVNLDGFYYDYTNLQVSTFADVTNSGVLSQVTLNAGEARSYGLETEIHYLLNESNRADVSFGYLNATYESFFLKNGDQFSGLGNPVDYTDNDLAKAPDFTVNIGYEHDFTLSKGILTGRIQTHYEGDKNLDYHNFDITEQDSYTKTDLILTYTPNTEDWSLMAYVRNIEDERPFIDLSPNTLTTAYGNVGAPRLIGARFSINF